MPKNGLSVRFPENRFLVLDCCGAWPGPPGPDGPYCKTVFLGFGLGSLWLKELGIAGCSRVLNFGDARWPREPAALRGGAIPRIAPPRCGSNDRAVVFKTF